MALNSRRSFFTPNFCKTVEQIEKILAEFYPIDTEVSAVDHLLKPEEVRNVVPELADQLLNSRGSVITVSEDEQAFLGMYVSEKIIRHLDFDPCHEKLHGENLDPFCVLVEEISHFHLLMSRLTQGKAVSKLEIEWQGEVDKVLISAAFLNLQEKDPHLRQLCSLVYESGTYIETEDIDRYREATFQAARFWSHILRQFEQPFHRSSLDRFRSVLRSTYRRSWQGKITLVDEIERTRAVA